MCATATGDLRPFPVTQWSLVARAGVATVETRRQALGVLLQRYMPALRAYLLVGKRVPRDRIEDLLQGFVSDKIIEQDLISHAEQKKGKFRNFLLVSLNRYIISELRREKAQKRSPGKGELAPLADETDAVDSRSGPAEHFNATWARQMIDEALQRMRTECQTSGRVDIWGVFENRIVLPALEGARPSEYEDLVKRFALQTPLQACNLLVTAKRMFSRMLGSVVGEYVDDDQMEDEINELKHVLARAR